MASCVGCAATATRAAVAWLLLVGVSAAQCAVLPQVHHFQGGQAEARLGVSLASPDVDGDGLADVVIGTPWYDGIGPDSGVVRVYSGESGVLLYERHGAATDSRFGHSLANAGDLDGDGAGDFIVGVPEVGWGPGRARVYSGASGQVIRELMGDHPGHYFGMSVAGLGDITGDSIPDIGVGARWDSTSGVDAGLVRLFSGSDGSPIADFHGDGSHDQLGFSLASAGDVDGDGVPDVVGGAPEVSGVANTGYARIWSGATLTVVRTAHGAQFGSWFGSSVAGAGDLDADGRADIIVGAPSHDGPSLNNSGQARVVSGLTGADLFVLNGDTWGASLGSDVDGGEDLNGDGIDDFTAGAPGHVTATGVVHVWSGVDGSLLAEYLGSATNHALGTVHFARSVNDDGLPEVFLGAPASDASGPNAGEVRVMTIIGHRSYGAGMGGSNTLLLTWNAGLPSAVGELAIAGLQPGLPGVVIASLACDEETIGSLTALVDLTPGVFTSVFPFTAPVSGTVSSPLPLLCPPVAGQVFYGQAFQQVPGGFLASQGMEFLFAR